MNEHDIQQLVCQFGIEIDRQTGRDSVQRARGYDGGIEFVIYKIDVNKVPDAIRGCYIGDFYSILRRVALSFFRPRRIKR